MTKTTRVFALMTGMALAAGSAHAQTAVPSKIFVNVNVGAQPVSHRISTNDNFTLFDEPATVTTSQGIHGGALFDISGGYNVWHAVSIGVGYSFFSRTSSSAVSATIPNAIFFNQPVTTASTQTGLKHTENAIHLDAVWFMPITTKTDIAISLGPSFTHLHQDYVSTVTTGKADPTTGISPATPAVATVSKIAPGVNIGVDGTYLFTPRIGGGVFLRYVGGSVGLSNGANAKVGGFQIGVGVRLRY